MKLLIAMLAVGLLSACPLLAQEAKVRSVEIKPAKVVVIEDEDESGKDLEKAVKEALDAEDLPEEVREALERAFRRALKKTGEKPPEGKDLEDVDETTVETLPDGTKIVRKIVRKTSNPEGKDAESDLDKELKKLREEIEKLNNEIDEVIRNIMEELGNEGDAEEVFETDLPGGGKIKIVKKVSRSGSGHEQPKAPKKSDDK